MEEKGGKKNLSFGKFLVIPNSLFGFSFRQCFREKKKKTNDGRHVGFGGFLKQLFLSVKERNKGKCLQKSKHHLSRLGWSKNTNT